MVHLLCISWTEKKTNEWILNKMDVSKILLTTIDHRKMAFIGHILGKGHSQRLITSNELRQERGRKTKN